MSRDSCGSIRALDFARLEKYYRYLPDADGPAPVSPGIWTDDMALSALALVRYDFSTSFSW